MVLSAVATALLPFGELKDVDSMLAESPDSDSFESGLLLRESLEDVADGV